MSVHGNYVYACKINGDTETSAVVARVNKDCRYDLSEEIVLMHDRPWVLEWDNAGTWGDGLLLAADHMSDTYRVPYLFRNNSIISIVYHDGSRHVQWSVKLSSYGIDINAPHTYTLRNIISDDGSNMIWLYVDGAKIAPLTTCCTNGSATSTTSEYLAGKDFVFSHIGTFQHDVTGGMAYMQVWEGGRPEEDEANNYRWETKDNRMVSIVNDTFEENNILPLKVTCTDGVYTDTQMMLEKPIILRHDRHWRLQWEAEGVWDGGGLLLSSTYSSYTANNLYIFRNAPRSAVYVYGGLMKSIRFANCKFESTCANSEVIGDSTSNRNGGAIRFAPFNSTTSTLVEELTIDSCEFDGNTAMRYGGVGGRLLN